MWSYSYYKCSARWNISEEKLNTLLGTVLDLECLNDNIHKEGSEKTHWIYLFNLLRKPSPLRENKVHKNSLLGLYLKS